MSTESAAPVFSPLIAWIERTLSSFRLLPALQESTTILEFFFDLLTFLNIIIGEITLTLDLKEDVNEIYPPSTKASLPQVR